MIASWPCEACRLVIVVAAMSAMRKFVSNIGVLLGSTAV